MRAAWLVLIACAHPPAAKSPGLAPGVPEERAIAHGEVHRYEIELDAGQVMLGAVDQLGVDVVVSTYGPDGKKLAELDAPTGSNGPETIQIEAKTAGTYRIEVAPFPQQRGRYRAHVDEIITARALAEREAKARAIVEQYFTERGEVVPAFVAWAKQSAITEVARLAPVIGKARVVSLGEADHGKKEYLAYRNELAKFLVEQHGFTAIVVESGFTETTVVDDYVMGSTTVTGRDAARAVFSWGMPMAMRENLELVDWLRAYNAKAQRKVHVYGMDLTGGRMGRFTESRGAVDAALGYLAQHDAAAHGRLLPRLAPLVAKFDAAAYATLADAQRTELREALAELVKVVKGDARAQRNAAVASVLEELFRAGNDPSIRDAAMAANVIWALEQEGAGSRVLVFSHNGHARKCELIEGPKHAAMGQYLAKSLRDQMVVIGFVHGDGPPTATLDGLLARVGLPRFVVDMRKADPVIRAGLAEAWDFKPNGKQRWAAKPNTCFDALAYTATSTSVQLLK